MTKDASVGVRVGRREIEITHPDKPLFGAPAVTKLDLARQPSV
jgi:DNA primase